MTDSDSSDHEDETSCSICLDPTESTNHTLECGHRFHVDCIVNWFRSGQNTCPLCRDATCRHRLNWLSVQERSKILRRRSRRKDAHPDLKKFVKRLKEAEERTKLYRHEVVAFKREHSELQSIPSLLKPIPLGDSPAPTTLKGFPVQ